MLASFLLLIASLFFCFKLLDALFPHLRFITKLTLAQVLAIFFSSWLVFLLSLLHPVLAENTLLVVLLLSTLYVAGGFVLKTHTRFTRELIEKKEFVLLVAAYLFGFFISYSTLSYGDNGELRFGVFVWSDFASHLPLVRSFSLGENMPPEFPLFPSFPIHYHFLFYFLAGCFEKLGVPFIHAINILSGVTFGALIVTIYSVGRELFKSFWTGLIASLLFLFNSTLIFVLFLAKQTQASLNIFQNAWNLDAYQSMGPAGGQIITIFWNLNVFVNQRHLASSLVLVITIFFIWILILTHKYHTNWYHVILAAVLTGLLPFWHSALFLVTLILVTSLHLVFFQWKKLFFLHGFVYALLVGVLSLSQLLLLKHGSVPGSGPELYFGFLAHDSFTLQNVFNFWFQNLGINFFLIPIAFFATTWQQKKIYIAIFSLFIVALTVKLSLDINNNHKLLTPWLILINLFVAHLLVTIAKKHWVGKIICVIALFFLCISGVLDFMVIKNMPRVTTQDLSTNPIAAWIDKNTQKDALFLTPYDVYHPASIAGRKIFYGWPYFAWSAGLPTDERDRSMRSMYRAHDLLHVCDLFATNKISYMSLENGRQEGLYWENKDFFAQHFTKVYEGEFENIQYIIYDVSSGCRVN